VNMVLSTCDQVVVLNFGGQIAAGTPTEIRHDPAVIEAYLGSSTIEQRSDDPSLRSSGTSTSVAGA
jgi:ABC-type multidrug transport system ATPase subunit